jgi:ubiquinol-cytochrome c reductase iron-sulfur subunit
VPQSARLAPAFAALEPGYNGGMVHDSAAAPRADTRRGFLCGATAAMGAAGVAAAAWPFLHQMNPDAAVRAGSDIAEFDLAGLHLAEHRVVRWRQYPVFVLRRSPAMLAAMEQPSFLAVLADPRSERYQQPAYAKNLHRSVDPAFGAFIGICTYCRCVPHSRMDEVQAGDLASAYACPCCNARYDPAGRAASVSRYNLAVPPYVMSGSRITIGKNPPGEMFSIGSVERV